MENKSIVAYSELVVRINELKVQKKMRENELQITFNAVATSLNLGSVLNSLTHQDKPMEFAKSGLKMALSLISGLLLGRHRSIKGYLSSMMVEKFTTLLVDNNLITIVAGISSLFKKTNNQ